MRIRRARRRDLRNTNLFWSPRLPFRDAGLLRTIENDVELTEIRRKEAQSALPEV